MMLAPMIFEGLFETKVYSLVTSLCDLYLELLYLVDAVSFPSFFHKFFHFIV